MTLQDSLRAYAHQLSLRLHARFTPLIWKLDARNDNSDAPRPAA